MPTYPEIVDTVRAIVSRAYGNYRYQPNDIQPQWYLRAPRPPLGMDNIRIAAMLVPLNAYIATYKPQAGITLPEITPAMTVAGLTKLVERKLGL